MTRRTTSTASGSTSTPRGRPRDPAHCPSRSGAAPARPGQDDRNGKNGKNGKNGRNGAPATKPTVKEHAVEGTASVVGWLDERTGASPFLRGFLYRKVPKGTNWYYTLGSATMFAFLSQAVTGVFLAMYYEPDPTRAYESASRITNEVFLGEFVRGMHKWGSTVMIILIFLHMGRVFFFGAYKYPRELNWVIGVVLIVLTLMMGLTGYLLPFDQRSFWATVVAVNLNSSGPIVGPYLADFLRAGLRVRADHDLALLLAPHACRAHPDRRADRRAPLPGGEARHDRAAVAQG